MQIISRVGLKEIKWHNRYLMRIKALKIIISSVWIAFDYLQNSVPCYLILFSQKPCEVDQPGVVISQFYRWRNWVCSWFSSQKPGSMWQSRYGLEILSFYPVPCQRLSSGCRITSDDEWLMASSGIVHSSVTPAFPMVPSTGVIITSSFWLPKASPPEIHLNPF